MEGTSIVSAAVIPGEEKLQQVNCFMWVQLVWRRKGGTNDSTSLKVKDEDERQLGTAASFFFVDSELIMQIIGAYSYTS